MPGWEDLTFSFYLWHSSLRTKTQVMSLPLFSQCVPVWFTNDATSRSSLYAHAWRQQKNRWDTRSTRLLLLTLSMTTAGFLVSFDHQINKNVINVSEIIRHFHLWSSFWVIQDVQKMAYVLRQPTFAHTRTPLINNCYDQQTVLVPVSVFRSLSQDTVLYYTLPYKLVSILTFP